MHRIVAFDRLSGLGYNRSIVSKGRNMAKTEKARQEEAVRVQKQLLQIYGEPQWRRHLEPVAELVSTILSQNTNDTNRDVAFEQLRSRFDSWVAVRDAETEQPCASADTVGRRPLLGAGAHPRGIGRFPVAL